jgi:hypothetical protein
MYDRIRIVTDITCDELDQPFVRQQLQEYIHNLDSNNTDSNVAVESILEKVYDNTCEKYKENIEVVQELKSDLNAFVRTLQQLPLLPHDEYVSEQDKIMLQLKNEIQSDVAEVEASELEVLLKDVKFKRQVVSLDENTMNLAVTRLCKIPNISHPRALHCLRTVQQQSASLFFPYKMFILMSETAEPMNELWIEVLQEYDRIAAISPKLADAVSYGAMNSYNILQKWLHLFLTNLELSIPIAQTAAPVVLDTLKSCRWDTDDKPLIMLFEKIVITNGDSFMDILRDSFVKIALQAVPVLPGDGKDVLLKITEMGDDVLQKASGGIVVSDTLHSFEEYESYVQAAAAYDLEHVELWMQYKCLLQSIVKEGRSLQWTWSSLVENYTEHYPQRKSVVNDWLLVFEKVHPIVHKLTPDQDVYSLGLDILGHNRVIFQTYAKTIPNFAETPFTVLMEWHNYLLS